MCLGSCRWTAPTCAFKEAGTYKLHVKTEPPQQPSTYTRGAGAAEGERDEATTSCPQSGKVAPPGLDAGEMPAARLSRRRCRAGLSLKLFPLLSTPSSLPPSLHLPSLLWMLVCRSASEPPLPAQRPPPCPGHRRPSQTGGLWLRGAGAGAGGTKVFLLVVVMEMMLPAAAAAGSLQRR